MMKKPGVDNLVPFSSELDNERWSIAPEGQYLCWRKLNTSFESQVSISLSKKHLGHIFFVGNLDAMTSFFVTTLPSRSANSRAKREFTAIVKSKNQKDKILHTKSRHQVIFNAHTHDVPALWTSHNHKTNSLLEPEFSSRNGSLRLRRSQWLWPHSSYILRKFVLQTAHPKKFAIKLRMIDATSLEVTTFPRRNP